MQKGLEKNIRKPIFYTLLLVLYFEYHCLGGHDIHILDKLVHQVHMFTAGHLVDSALQPEYVTALLTQGLLRIRASGNEI